ncbi:MAG: Mov34/MPN/PAD-1 family protein [Methanocellales archaeon]
MKKEVKGIARDTLKFILAVSRDSHPREFAGLLRVEKDVITEVLILPGTESSNISAILRLDMMPLDTSVIGTVHSHCSSNLKPSKADLELFAKCGRYHIITCYPYREVNWCCYDSFGRERNLKVLDIEFDNKE